MTKTELERIAQLEIIANENKTDIVKLKEEAQAFYRITVNQEMLTKTLNTLVSDNKEQMRDFGNTLNRVNTNLTNLNHNQETLKITVDQVNNRVDKAIDDINDKVDTVVDEINSKVDEIEEGLETEKNKSVVFIKENMSKWLGWLAFGLPTMIIGAWLMYYFGSPK